ncbi:MAG: S9 family peptidase [Winogradskyella sp.]|uniref:prolyl oligopeptidase family serine peptidase n=1 Tax=Winogradskyella sp. TaxID=1883156 RepID=UPI0017F5BB47|nr:prolyl oligopeptidase family serine peptidase [Winogradskyella sp.]MBT8244088.1 prolyl oligopeptidase family serine peptidase [Winogradskyella sp.]NNK22689.1 S9 family peptidase [Winogradskyella sp.]
MSNRKFVKDELSKSVEYPEFDNIISEQIMVISHDGAEVPLSIIYDKTKITEESPTMIEAYGAYGDSTNPYYAPLILGWVAEGGIYCTAHVRGGGEKGEDWHNAGLKTTKPNSWKDLIACSEYMIENKFTTNKNIALYGSSAGGIVVGRAMTERPDLFAAVISEYGVLNPTRMETQPGGGGSNIKEFGTMKDSTEAMAMIEMDSYLHIIDSIDYPATYLTVGMNDPRVVPWESGKFAARLQNVNQLKKPVLLYADFESGHEGNQTSDRKIYEEWGNVFAFVFWQTGHPDFQLKNN